MRRLVAILPLAVLATTRAANLGHVRRQAPAVGEANSTYIQICPNPNYEDLDESIRCMNITPPTKPKGYGGHTCISLTYTPLRVGSPQGISSCRTFGNLNCTLYKTEDCLPDTPTNAFIVPPGGAPALPRAGDANVTDPQDDLTVAFQCKALLTL